MSPFSVQNLCLSLKNISYIKSNLINEKYKFCMEFEKELDIPNGNYSEDVFDFIYNLYDNRRIFKDSRFTSILSDFISFNFLQFHDVMEYISNIYNEMIFLGKDYFFSIFKFDHEDSNYMNKKFKDNRAENIEKLLKHF